MIADHSTGLAAEILRGNTKLAEPLLELLLLPLAYQVVLLLITLATPFAPTRIYALVGLSVVSVHVLAGIVVGGGNLDDFASLLAAPLYLIWKLAMSRMISKTARRDSAWLRTER